MTMCHPMKFCYGARVLGIYSLCFGQLRASALRNSPSLSGRARSRFRIRLLIHQACEPLKAWATGPGCRYFQFSWSITSFADPFARSAPVPA
jgi:hypothetical protein